MNYFVMLLIAGALAGLLGLMPAQQDPPCKCEVTVYKKKRKGAVPCIVGILRDSATQKPLTRNSLVFNSTVDTTLWADKRGHTYTDVLSGKEYTLIAKCFPYYFCTQKVVAQQGDSIVCVFNMRLSREGSEGPGSFIHK